MTLDHRRCQTLIARSFEQGVLSARDHDAMRAHVRDCETCERVYERYAAAEAALYPRSADRPTHAGQVDRVAQRLFAREAPAGAAGRERGARWAVGGALAAAAAVAIVVAAPGSGPRDVTGAGPDDGLRSRQGGVAAVAPDASLRALRVRPGESGPQVTDLGSGAAVRAGDRVALLYTNLGDLDRVAIDRVTPDGSTTSVVEMTDIRADVEDERLKTLVVTEDWAEGVHVLRARFVGPGGRETVREVRLDVEAP
jgi:hypothetical protein